MVEDKLFDDPGSKKDDDNDANKDVPEQFQGMSKAEMAKVIQTQEEGLSSLTGRFNNLAGQFNEVLEGRKKDATKKDDDKEKPDWDTDPAAAASALFDEKIRPHVGTFLAHAEAQQNEDLSKLPYYEDFKDEIDTVLAKSDPRAKAVPGYARSAYNMIVGAHIDKVKEIDTKRAEKVAEHTETESSAGTGGKQAPAAEQLTDLQKRTADGLGQSHAKYAAWLNDPAKARETTLAAGRGKGAS